MMNSCVPGTFFHVLVLGLLQALPVISLDDVVSSALPSNVFDRTWKGELIRVCVGGELLPAVGKTGGLH